MNKGTITHEKFYLGFEDERWASEIPGLAVPMNDGSGKSLLVVRFEDNTYSVISNGGWQACETLIETIALVQTWLIT